MRLSSPAEARCCHPANGHYQFANTRCANAADPPAARLAGWAYAFRSSRIHSKSTAGSITILSPYCFALIPLSPTWGLSRYKGIRVSIDKLWKLPAFEVVRKKDMSPSTVRKGGQPAPIAAAYASVVIRRRKRKLAGWGSYNTALWHPIFIRFTGAGSLRYRAEAPGFTLYRWMCYSTVTGY